MAKFKVGKNQILAGVGVILLLGAAAGVGFLVQLLTRPPVASQVATPRLPEVVNEVQKLRTSGDTTGFDEKVKATLADPKTDSSTRYMLYIQQGNAFSDAKQYDKAIAAYKQAETVNQTYETAQLLAETYNTAGDAKSAIDYYKIAIKRIPPNSPVGDADKNEFEQKIKLLGGQP